MGSCWVLRMENPLASIVGEIRKAFDAGLYYVGVALTLTLPDLCVTLESGEGRARQAGYQKFYQKYLADRLLYLSADDFYSFRCGVLHNGKFGGLKHEVKRVVFVAPYDGNAWVSIRVGDVYMYSMMEFCEAVIDATDRWYADSKDNPNVAANAERLVKFRPNGMRPFGVGIPLIA